MEELRMDEKSYHILMRNMIVCLKYLSTILFLIFATNFALAFNITKEMSKILE